MKLKINLLNMKIKIKKQIKKNKLNKCKVNQLNKCKMKHINIKCKIISINLINYKLINNKKNKTNNKSKFNSKINKVVNHLFILLLTKTIIYN